MVCGIWVSAVLLLGSSSIGVSLCGELKWSSFECSGSGIEGIWVSGVLLLLLLLLGIGICSVRVGLCGVLKWSSIVGSWSITVGSGVTVR